MCLSKYFIKLAKFHNVTSHTFGQTISKIGKPCHIFEFSDQKLCNSLLKYEYIVMSPFSGSLALQFAMIFWVCDSDIRMVV